MTELQSNSNSTDIITALSTVRTDVGKIVPGTGRHVNVEVLYGV